jgi:sulfite exporter TauE/SafE
MLSSINPLGERTRRQGFWVTVSWYLLGSLLGGVALGSVSGLIGSVLPSGNWRAIAVIVVCLVGAGLDIVSRQPPSIHRQVDENWLAKYRGWVYGLGFGFQLGLGVVTIVTTASVYTTIALATLSGSPVFGAVVGGVFGLARATAIFLVARAHDPSTLRRALRRLQDGLRSARLLVVGTQAAAALSAIVWIIR